LPGAASKLGLWSSQALFAASSARVAQVMHLLSLRTGFPKSWMLAKLVRTMSWLSSNGAICVGVAAGRAIWAAAEASAFLDSTVATVGIEGRGAGGVIAFLPGGHCAGLLLRKRR